MTRISPNHPAGRRLNVVRQAPSGASAAAGAVKTTAAVRPGTPAIPVISNREARGREVPSRPKPPLVTTRALVQADAELAAAFTSTDPAEQFRHAHLAAIRSAAAIVEFRGRPHPKMRARTVWEMLTVVEPEFAPWATYFASGAALRAMVESGLGDQVDAMRAAEVTACAEDFRDEVTHWFEVAFADPGDSSELDKAAARTQLRLVQPVAA